MSFIYEDKELLESFFKMAQTKAPNIDPSQLRLTVLKAISNLRQAYSPVKVDGNVQLFQKNVFNLNSLLLWLVDNKVKVDGHRVAYALTPAAQPGSPAAQRTAPGQTGEQIDQTDAQINYVQYSAQEKVWKEGLVEFLKTLRKQAADSGNIYFQELVSKVIEDANTHKVLDTGLDLNEPAETKQETKPAAQETKPTQNQTQPVNQQQQAEQASYMPPQETIKEQNIGSVIESSLPFDLTTDEINMARFVKFTNAIHYLMNDEKIRQNMVDYMGSLGTNLSYIYSGIENFKRQAADTPVQEGGFTLSASDNADNFANLVGKDYAKARNILVVLSPLVLALSNVVNSIRAIPFIKEQIGDDILRGQVQRGRDYVNTINGFITYINIKAGRAQ
jgi:hypothetical protein